MSHFDKHFKQFAVSLERAIDKYGGVEEITLVERQKQQVETLVALEKKFRKTLIKHHWGPGVYRAFLDMIVEEKGNILAARPFFRERQDVFIERIAKALRHRNPKLLYPFSINYQFVRFVLSQRKWWPNSEITKLAMDIAKLRTEIVEMNMPLAISRARIFWSQTPRSHLSYMDLVQISCEGLIAAVDKFVLPYSKVFRSVAIGRIVGNFIEDYSQTLIHFYPQDKRKIYRANKALGRQPVRGLDHVDFEQLANEVNKEEKPDSGEITIFSTPTPQTLKKAMTELPKKQKTNRDEISGLLAAASHVSADSIPVNDTNEGGNPIERYAADESVRPDFQFENAQLSQVLREAYRCLTLVEKKLLKMKGLEAIQ